MNKVAQRDFEDLARDCLVEIVMMIDPFLRCKILLLILLRFRPGDRLELYLFD